MKEVTKTYQVFSFNELGEEAKEKAKMQFLEDRPVDWFSDAVEFHLKELFPNSDLKVQFSLSYSQGDGVNVYGDLSLTDILKHLDMKLGMGKDRQWTDEESKYIRHCSKVLAVNEIKLPYNARYCYCFINRADFWGDWVDELSEMEGEIVNASIIKKFNKMIINVFTNLCLDFEKQGYQYFYEISDEDMEELSEANYWEYLEDGTLFV